MTRPDLLALTTDDLEALGNPGLLKRAQKELAAGEPTCEIEESADGNVKVSWSDGIECRLPANTVLSKSLCSCPATPVCRHLLRSVLAYQQKVSSPVLGGNSGEAATPGVSVSRPWNPAAIPDELLAKYFTRTSLSRTRQIFERGQVIEVITGRKPSAHLHMVGCTVRFQVEGDPRYTHCDCTEEAPCSHVLLAVWAFRLLPDGQEAGLVETRTAGWPVPSALLDELEGCLIELAVSGLANSPQALFEHLRRLESRCQNEGLAWPAAILTEIVQEAERYTARDARFEPERVVELVAELLIRATAIRSDTGAVPQLFIRGGKTDNITEIGPARLVGLGCEVKIKRKGVELASYLQNFNNGQVLAVRYLFADSTEPVPFSQLAQTVVTKGINMAALGSGQLVIKEAKRTAGHQLIFSRAALSAGSQTYQWEKLRAPLLVESFAQLHSHLKVLPPAPLQPRHLNGNFYVCPVAGVQSVRFSVIEQAIVATIRDHEGCLARLYHPYTGRGKAGCEVLLDKLGMEGQSLRFVAGPVRITPNGPVFLPVGLVFEPAGAGRRVMVQPWIENLLHAASSNLCTGSSPTANLPLSSLATYQGDTLSSYLSSMLTALAELFVVGLERVDYRVVRLWKHLYEQGKTLGFVRLLQSLARLIETLSEKEERLVWNNWQEAAALALLDLTLLSGLAQAELANLST